MKELCVATYNIFHGGMVLSDIGILGRELLRLGADIVGLQEVDVGSLRVGGRDTLRMIAEDGGYPYYAFARAMDFADGGMYGTAILSKFPILSCQTVPLSSPDVEPRSVGHAVIDVDGVRLDFFNTHLSVEKREVRNLQIAELKTLISAASRVILTGDFNTESLDDFSPLSPLKTVNPRAFGSYYPTNSAIDHIFLSDAFKVSDVSMPALLHSDHYPIVAHVAFDA